MKITKKTLFLGAALGTIAAIALVILLFFPGSDGEDEIAEYDPVQMPTSIQEAEKAPLSSPPDRKKSSGLDVLLTINESQEEQVLFTDIGCILEVRLRNIRAHLSKQEKETKRLITEAEHAPGSLLYQDTDPIIIGTDGLPVEEMIRFFGRPDNSDEEIKPLEFQPRKINMGTETSETLSLDGSNEGHLYFITDPDSLGLFEPGGYLIYTVIESSAVESGPANHFQGRVRSNAIPVRLSQAPDRLAPEESDLRTYLQARLALLEDDKELAVQIVDRGLEKLPDGILSLVLKAEILESEGLNTEAYSCLERALNSILEKALDSEEKPEPPTMILGRMKVLKAKISEER